MPDKPSTSSAPAGTIIPEPGMGKVFNWLAERLYLTALVRVCNAFLNLVVNVVITYPDGTSATKQVRPKIADSSATLEIPIDLSQSSLGSGSSTTTTFQITAIGTGDYFTAQTWDGTTLGGVDFFIAKKIDFRESLVSEVVDGVTITHTYSDDNNRTSSDGVSTQDEVCWPRFAVGAEVQAALCANGTPVADVDWIDLTARMWGSTD